MSKPEAAPSRQPRGRRAFVREREVVRVQQKLEDGSYPRLHMSLMVALTGASGWLSSFLLLRMGVEGMALRYPLSLALAYGVFLFLIWLWLRTRLEDYVDLPDIPDIPRSATGASDANELPFRSGGGGDFGGGGSSASFDASSAANAEPAAVLDTKVEAASAWGDVDEYTVPLLAVVLAVGLALASFYVIYIAPVFLAEVLVDSALSYALYRYLCGDSPSHWLATAVRRTFLPFLATAFFLAIAGASLGAYAPGARSIGEAVHWLALAR